MTFDIPVLILARKGSKRIKDKNIVDFCGKPLIVHAIEKALKVSKNVYVSSNSQKILDLSKSSGARCLIRPENLCYDTSSSVDGVLHFFEVKKYNDVCLLQVTAPLIRASHILEGIKKYKNKKYDSVISAYKKKVFIWDHMRNPLNFSIKTRNRTQEHDYVFVENGGFYISSLSHLKKNLTFFSGNVGFCEIEERYSVDIDNYEDLKIAKLMSGA